jgi:ribose transport system substrate-binding protein
MLGFSTWKVAVAGVATLALALALAACGSSSSTTAAKDASASGSAGVAEATAAIQPYVGKPSTFPVTQPLKKIPKGATVVYADCGSTGCGLLYELMVPAAKTMGLTLKRVIVGSDANTVGPGFDSIVSLHPSAVVVPAIDPSLFQSQLKELQAAHIPVVTSGITGAQAYGVESPQYGTAENQRDGALMADYLTAEYGSHANVVFYGVPEYPFSPVFQTAFDTELAKVCPGCTSRTVQIPVATIGNTAPSAMVSDLEAHPNTDIVVLVDGELAEGLPAALKAASIHVKILTNAPEPLNLVDLKQGTETSGLGLDIATLCWTVIDEVARELTGQPLTGNEANGLGVIQFLTKKDITFNPANGWTGYPDLATRFAKLWGVSN